LINKTLAFAEMIWLPSDEEEVPVKRRGLPRTSKAMFKTQ